MDNKKLMGINKKNYLNYKTSNLDTKNRMEINNW